MASIGGATSMVGTRACLSSAIILTNTLRLRACVLEALAGIGALFTFVLTIAIELFLDVMDVDTTRLITPADYIDFYGDPFNVVSTAAPGQWKGKGKLILRKEVPTVVQTDENVDWTKFEPPTALRTAPTVNNEILLQIITSSIEKVKTQVAEEDRVKRQQSNARRQREEALKREAEEALSKNKEPYLPIIIPETPPTPEEPKSAEATFEDFLHSDLSGNGEGSSSNAPLIVFQPTKSKKDYKFKFARFLGRKKTDGKDKVAARLEADLHRNSIYGTPFENLRATLQSRTNTLDSLESRTLISVPEPAPPPEPEPVQQVECVSCLDDFPIAETIKVPCHHYCHECFERLITAACANEQQWPPKCCLNDIPVRTIRSHIPAALATTYNDRSAEWSAPIAERIYCSRRDCTLFVPPSRIDRANRVARCDANHRTCTLCREEFHENRECPRDREFELTEALAEEEGWLHCGRCRALVEHREACQHMTCRCGYEFCYVCNAVWQTCRCNMADLNRKKEQVLARRERRLVAEAEAEAELQEALRQIEEFEREEALKAELLRQEQERQEEERRQRELEERIRREGIRRREVEIKFAELRGVLADLHALQRVMVGHQQTTNAENLERQAKDSKEALSKKHEEDRAELDAKVAGKLEAKEAVFSKEYAVRVAEEKALEDAYLLQLSEFYTGKKGAEERVSAEMMRFRKKMDRGWRTWRCWRDDELAAYRVKVEEERTIKDELMFSAELRLKESWEERAANLEKEKKADAQWVELVIAERERMLDEAEVEELDNGDDAASLFASSEEGSGCA